MSFLWPLATPGSIAWPGKLNVKSTGKRDISLRFDDQRLNFTVTNIIATSCLSKALLTIKINEVKMNVLVDTGSSEFHYADITKKVDLKSHIVIVRCLWQTPH